MLDLRVTGRLFPNVLFYLFHQGKQCLEQCCSVNLLNLLLRLGAEELGQEAAALLLLDLTAAQKLGQESARLLLLLRCTEELGQKSALLLLRLSAEHAEQSAHIIAVLLLRVIGRCGKAAQKCRCDQAEEALYLVLLYAGLLG